MLLILPEILLKIVDVFQNLFQNVVKTFRALMLQGGTFGPQELRVFLVVIEALYTFLDVSLNQLRNEQKLTSICWILCLMGI